MLQESADTASQAASELARPETVTWAARAFAAVVLVAAFAWLRIVDRILRAVTPLDAQPRAETSPELGVAELGVAESSVAAPSIVAPAPPWGLAHVGGVILGFVAGSIAIGMMARAAGWDRDDTLTLLSLSALTQGFAVALVVIVVVQAGRAGARALGLGRGRTFLAPLAGVVVYVSLLPAIMAVGFVWKEMLAALGHPAEPQELIEMFGKLAPLERPLPILLGTLVVPLFEETLFRGFLQPVLIARFRPMAGIALTSVAFAGLHGLDAFLPIFALSCVLGAVMWRTRQLHACWAIHALHNGLQFLFLYLIPELARG